jgi:hypothetical protein
MTELRFAGASPAPGDGQEAWTGPLERTGRQKSRRASATHGLVA